MSVTVFRIWRNEKLPYTQPPHLTSEEIESLLKRALVARFCSLNANGTIHAVPVWYRYLEGKIVVATPVASRKARMLSETRTSRF
jgi:nitroimidazol reductase NimA-like FMN-containing flavoprotein (pyridoxamine 5'-phosphate oxidase superfamily)